MDRSLAMLMPSKTRNDRRRLSRRVTFPRSRAAVGAFVVSGLIFGGVGIQFVRLLGEHAAPQPKGMIARFELPPNWGTFMMPAVVAHGGDPFAIQVGGVRDGLGHFFTFPSGEHAPPDVQPIDAGVFDFDGDGLEDRIETQRGIVRVVSGVAAQVLFEDEGSDPMDYRLLERACALPDLDGDGGSELALYHPRSDCGYFDFCTIDGLLDVKGWLTVVSFERP